MSDQDMYAEDDPEVEYFNSGQHLPPSPRNTEQMNAALWSRMPNDLFARIVSWMPISAILRSRSVCKDWNVMIASSSFLKLYKKVPSREHPWLLMCSSFNCRENCCAYNPSLNKWHMIPLTFLPIYMRFPLTAVGGLLFVRGVVRDALTSVGHLAVCNPVTQVWRELPRMTHGRLNSLVGVIEDKQSQSFKIVVAGGTSECGGDYECTTEVFDSLTNSWQVTGKVPREYTVKITVWTSKTVYCDGVLYCLTSARPYNIMAYDMMKGVWEEVRIPQPEILFCSFLIQRRGRLILVGGVGSDRFCQRVHIWELQHGGHNGKVELETQKWVEIERMPGQHFRRFFKGKADFDLKCAGSGDLFCFFKDSHSDMLICDFSKSPAEWRWLPRCPLSARFLKFAIRGLFVDPRLDSSVY